MNIEEKIIKEAKEIAKGSFMDFPDFDPELPINLADALTIIITYAIDNNDDDDIASDELYDFICTQLNRSDYE